MSVLREEIKNLFQDIDRNAPGRVTAKIMFPVGFSGFEGHFPDNPVVPGVCKVLAAQVLLGQAFGRKISLKTLILAKFSAPVTAAQELIFELSCKEDPAVAADRVKVVISREGKKVSELQLEVVYA